MFIFFLLPPLLNPFNNLPRRQLALPSAHTAFIYLSSDIYLTCVVVALNKRCRYFDEREKNMKNPSEPDCCI
jgi:hypothetical protein